MPAPYALTWDLDSIFTGGSDSPGLKAHLDAIEQGRESLLAQMASLPVPDSAAGRDAWFQALTARQQVMSNLHQAWAYIGCLSSQDAKDVRARILAGRASQLAAGYAAVEIGLKEKIREISKAIWQSLLADERFQPIRFRLQELRDDVAEMLSPEVERVMADLSVDGYVAWARLYQTVVNRVQIEVESDGKTEKLSAGQAYNRFADPDPAFRADLMKRWEEAWSNEAEICAAALNSIAGFRLANYRHHQFPSPLERGLKGNRMQAATLAAMWNSINQVKPVLAQYFRRKAKLLGVKALHWYDEISPLSAEERQFTYDEAADFVVEQFNDFSPKMAQFAQLAFDQRWIEAEDRPAKGAGAYCTGLPLTQQSRIFMTFGGSARSVETLAHELGHGYHNHVQWDLPPLARGFTMSTAETASTFAELVVGKASLDRAESRAERLSLLDGSARRTVTMFMNLHARFIFEQRLYEARAKGLLSVDRLNEMMVQAQKEAFTDGLASYHPHFWASKGHFYGTGTPFYNYPYVFGYLFAAGIYARAHRVGPEFEERYAAILRDTGRMTTEELARRHLDVDLTGAEFWDEAVDLVMADVRALLAETEA